MNQLRSTARKLVKKYFKNDYGQPFELSDHQCDLFNLIYAKAFPRNQIIASTQYGKSDVISMALIVRSQAFREQWAIVAGQKDKAQIIMSRVLQHIFDSEKYYSQLELDANMPLDRLRRERSKDNITWLGGGGIKTFTANTTNRTRVESALTGFGSPNIIEDEASLIPNDVQAMVLRMLGGHKDNFLLKIGNPFFRNHFYKTWHDSKYNKLFIDYKTALSEGRYTEEFIEEMRGEPFFDVLYECKFPSEDEITIDGWRKLIKYELLENAFISKEEGLKLIEGSARLGVDISGGGSDRSVYVVRYPKVMFLERVNKIADTMQQIPILMDIKKKYNLNDASIAIDYGGLGQGLGDRLKEQGVNINTVMFGQSAPETGKYKNMRAYMYYNLYRWLVNGGKIVKDDGFLELNAINYKEDSEKKFQIQPKEELKLVLSKMGIKVSSPDIADAAALTFADNSHIVTLEDFEFI